MKKFQKRTRSNECISNNHILWGIPNHVFILTMTIYIHMLNMDWTLFFVYLFKKLVMNVTFCHRKEIDYIILCFFFIYRCCLLWKKFNCTFHIKKKLLQILLLPLSSSTWLDLLRLSISIPLYIMSFLIEFFFYGNYYKSHILHCLF